MLNPVVVVVVAAVVVVTSKGIFVKTAIDKLLIVVRIR